MRPIETIRGALSQWRAARDDYKQLDSLLIGADPSTERAEQILWLVDLMRWLRAPTSNAFSSSDVNHTAIQSEHTRLKYLTQVLDKHPQYADRFAAVFARVLSSTDALSLFVDTGLATRYGLARELWTRIKLRVLPAAPNDGSLATVFSHVFRHRDHAWLSTLEPTLASSAFNLITRHAATAAALERNVAHSMLHLTSLISTSLTDAAIRQRATMSDDDLQRFLKLPALAVSLIEHEAGEPTIPLLNQFRAALDRARETASGVYEHLDQHGVSVTVVFDVEQLLLRIDRLQQLIDLRAAQAPHAEALRFIVSLIEANEKRASIRGLLRENYALLGKKVVERSAETGEHYIARSRYEYFAMLKRASGGGAITALTVYGKFWVTGLGLSRFFEGLFLFFDYAASFLTIHFAHFTLATKQPAMTAPALAAKLEHVSRDDGRDAFVEETIALIRSQVAAVIGNLAIVAPVAIAIQFAWIYLSGHATMDVAKAQKTIDGFSIVGLTPLFAAFTGVLLWLSSLAGGWADNWVALHRLGDGVRFHQRINRAFGRSAAQRIAAFIERHAAGVASNVTLAFFLGFTPIVAAFFGVGLDVRHVTLSTGSIAAASVVLGSDVLFTAAFWLAAAGVLAMGALNIGVSFYLAFAMALSSSRVNRSERSALRAQVIREILRRPWRVVLPPKAGA